MSFEGTPSVTLNLAITRPETYVFTAFASITLALSIEIVTLTLATFKRYQGVYFYSLLVTSFGLTVNTIGYLLFFFTHVSPYAAVTVILLGWYCMVTGHSVVLWSRLHLVLHRPRLLRAILYLIIFNALTQNITITVLLYGSISSRQYTNYEVGYDVVERIQLVVFCLQELLLSGIYIYETGRLLQLRPQRAHQIIMVQLIAINIIILFLDVAVVVLQFSGLYAMQVMFKPLAYSVKVRLEYAILGRLVQIATNCDCIRPTPSWPAIESTDSSCRRGEATVAEGI
ncbi:hypothetical protein BJY01DRAFT_230746 [Aspergillus pseudoustus]|uniref:DUF7703 domain-containing protein n=1 Tax=Aspergillus pseudoustus TaxID=1810923 RepID=A0ABR4L211_9EURO